MTFDEIMGLLPANVDNFNALVEAVRKRTIVPFTGAGISAAYYPLWSESLEQLKIKAALDKIPKFEQEFRNCHNEIEKCGVLEKAMGTRALCRALCEMFDSRNFTSRTDICLNEQPAVLLPLLFPQMPLLTTNLDRMMEEVYRILKVPFSEALSPTDHNILTVLSQQRAHGILYLHGKVSGQLTDYRQLVFSQKQYEQHYVSGSPLVSSFQNWLAGSQLLFIGCSLHSDRTLDILGKIYANNNRLEHFAILSMEENEHDYVTRMVQLEETYGIRAILYPSHKHEAVRIVLAELLRRTDPDGYQVYSGMYNKKSYLVCQESTDLFNSKAWKTEFFGRENELEMLEEFCSNQRVFCWWAVTGPGGSGKTRLTEELAEFQRKQGWSVWQLGRGDYNSDKLRQIKTCLQKLLVISDYSGEHIDVLEEWINDLSHLSIGTVRLLLIERIDTNIDINQSERKLKISWYDRLLHGKSNPQNIKRTQYGNSGEFLQLSSMTSINLKGIIQSYADKAYHCLLTEKEIEQIYTALLQVDSELHRPLFTIFLTDNYLQSNRSDFWEINNSLDAVLEREERLVVNQLKSCCINKDCPDDAIDVLTRLRLLATITDGIRINEVENEWKEFCDKIRNASYRKPRKLLYITQLISSEEDYNENDILINPLKPDLLGEYFVLKNIECILSRLFIDHWLVDERRRAFIDRLITDYSDTLPESCLKKLFNTRPVNENEAERMLSLFLDMSNESLTEKVARDVIGSMKRIILEFPVLSMVHIYCSVLFNITFNLNLHGFMEIIEELRGLIESDEYKGDHDIAFIYAKCLVNLAHFQELTDCRKTVKRLRRLSESPLYEGNRDIALAYANSLFTLSNKQNLAGCISCIERLQKLSESKKYRGDREFAIVYAQGLLTLSTLQANNTKTVEKLRVMSESDIFLGDNRFVSIYAKGLVNLSIKQRLSDCMETVDKLRKLSESENYKGDCEIALEYASILYNLSIKQDVYGCKETIEKLRKLSESNPYIEDRNIACVYADGLLVLGEKQRLFLVTMSGL